MQALWHTNNVFRFCTRALEGVPRLLVLASLPLPRASIFRNALPRVVQTISLSHVMNRVATSRGSVWSSSDQLLQSSIAGMHGGGFRGEIPAVWVGVLSWYIFDGFSRVLSRVYIG